MKINEATSSKKVGGHRPWSCIWHVRGGSQFISSQTKANNQHDVVKQSTQLNNEKQTATTNTATTGEILHVIVGGGGK
jgi:hypothetical protein